MNPCGLIANSFFNDTYQLFNGQTEIQINQQGIAWESDLQKFQYLNNDVEQAKKLQWVNVTDEHFMVWMRTAGMPNFRKLWGQVEEKLKQGTEYTIEVRNNYDVELFDG